MERPDIVILDSMRNFTLLEPAYIPDRMTARQQRRHEATRKRKERK